jgi:ParB-like chromosome segregation protein Spo0J
MHTETSREQLPERAEREVTLEELGGTLAALRLCDDEGIGLMRDSLVRQGQLTALVVYRQGDLLEVVDGFKRLRAAQQLGWRKLRVRELAVDSVGAKAALMVLNHGHGLTELEEAWLVRALYRHDRLGQPQIARLLARDKSWVSRRLLLAEGLDETVTADVRLGLLGSGAATAVARLPRGNQRAVTDLAMKQGLTRHQVERLVTDLMARPAAERATVLSQMMERAQPTAEARPPGKGGNRPRTLAEWIAVDITIITRQCARLQARLLQQPLATLGEQAARLTTDGLVELRLALDALVRTIARVTAMERRGDGRADA